MASFSPGGAVTGPGLFHTPSPSMPHVPVPPSPIRIVSQPLQPEADTSIRAEVTLEYDRQQVWQSHEAFVTSLGRMPVVAALDVPIPEFITRSRALSSDSAHGGRQRARLALSEMWSATAGNVPLGWEFCSPHRTWVYVGQRH